MLLYIKCVQNKCGENTTGRFQCLRRLFCIVGKVTYLDSCNEDAKEIPTCSLYPDLQDEWMESAEHRKKVLHQISKDFVKKFVDFKFNHLGEDTASSSEESMAVSSEKDKSYENDVFLYAKRLLSLGCFYLGYSDCIREGDGDCNTRCWRYMLPMFHSSGRKNYALESLNLLFQHDFSLSPRQAAELV